MLQLLLPFQRLFIPGFIVLLLWGSYRTIFKKDRAVGLVLYLGLVIIVDTFFNTAVYIPGLEYGSIRYSEICAFFLIVNNPSVKGGEKKNSLILFLIIIFFLLMFYSAFRAWTVENGLNNFRRYFVPQIVAFIVAYRGFEKSEDYSRFLLFFVILLIIIGTFTFWDLFFDRWILKSGKLHDKIYWGSRKNGRFGSLFLNPNYMGAFAVLTIPVVFIRALVEKETGKRIFCWLGVLALVFAFIETQSRGPMLGILVALFFFIVVPVKRFSFAKKVSYLLLLLAVLYLFMPGFFTHSTERFSMIDKETSDDHKSRYSVWEYTVEIIKEYPFFGVGLGEVQYKKYMYKFGFRSEFLERPLDNAHNSYLQIAVHAGIPAVLIFILINILLVKRGIFAVSGYGEREISLYLLGLIAGLLGFLACLIPDMFMFTATVGPSYWVMTGLIFSIINYQKRFVEE